MIHIVNCTQVFYECIYLFIILSFGLLSSCERQFALVRMTAALPRGHAGLQSARTNARQNFCHVKFTTKQNKTTTAKKKTGAYAALALTYTNTNRSFVAPALSYQFKHMSTHAERGGQMESQRGLLAFHTPET